MEKHQPYRRLWNPKIWTFVLAIVASLALHLPVYEVLGVLADILSAESTHHSSTQSPIEFEIAAAPQAVPTAVPTNPLSQAEEQAIKKEALPDVKKLKEIKTPPSPEKEKVAQPAQKLKTEMLQAIQQRSQDPEVKAPDNARYIAKENQRVKEETVARNRSYTQDDPQPQAAASKQAEDQEGADEQQEIAAHVEQKGQEKHSPSEEASPSMATTAAPNQRNERAASPSTTAAHDTVVRDAFGSFRLSTVEGSRTQRGSASQQPRTSANRAAYVPSHATQPNLRVSWNTFEQTIGADELSHERQAYRELRKLRRSKQQGKGSKERWKEFRAAIENFVPNVRPGNQTALNAVASPFAEYLTAVHRQIHVEFADEFLPSLPAGTGPYSDRNLMTKLEIILNRDGSVHRVGVVQSSGLLPFDYGAFAAVMNAQPYPTPPSDVLSGDSRVYFHWGFYRNERQCGTFNAEAYILPNPPSSKPGKAPLQDGPAWDTVLPTNARPANHRPNS